METRQYSNDDIVVSWEHTKCIHSTICWKGLPRVFNSQKKPWIALENSNTAAIINQVKQCPSGAISFKHKKDKTLESNQSEEQVGLLKVQVASGGPLLVHGAFNLEHNNVTQNMNKKVTALCRCGQSQNKPFCDGSHTKIEFDR